jgi:asparaginyl-tRNA synthetase
MYTTIKQAQTKLGKPVTLAGWIFNLRSSGSIAFLQFRDGSGQLQCVVGKDKVSAKVWQAIKNLTIESSVIITGKIKKEKRAPGGYEMEVKELAIVQLAEEYPIGKKEHGPDFLLSNRHLWLRSRKQIALMKVRDTVMRALRCFMYQEGFICADSPILTPNAVEGTSTLFDIDYFKEGKAYLSQSGQLYQEATSAALGKSYAFGPTFRAEKSKTRRHLTEFWMLEPEASFITFEENLALQEKLILYTIKHVLEENPQELAILERDTGVLKKIKAPFARIKYQDAIKHLQKMGVKIKEGDEIGADEEAMLTEKTSQPLFITHFPVHLKAFYMEPDPKDSKVTLSADLLAPEGYGEIIGGSQRISDKKLLEKRLKEFKLPAKAFEWYLDLRRFGSVPHGGFGLGLERVVAWLTGTHHIRETIPFPRTIHRIYP